VLVSIEALFGLLGIALLTGIVFAKFSRPRAGVVFSRSAIIAQHNGVPSLMFRVANERGSDIVEASMRLSALMDANTSEGKALRRFYDLPLERSTTPLLLMSWLIIHPIDPKSPLHGKTAEDWLKDDVRIIASVTGIDGTFMQTVYAYHVYTADNLVHDADFADVIRRLPDGRYELHLGKFHDLKVGP
jgi:inward rectifier potassium channel